MSRFLLDTNVLLIMGLQSPRLSTTAREALARPGAQRWVSSVSAIEIAIKSSVGKLSLPPPFTHDFSGAFLRMLDELAISLLEIDLAAIARLRALPLHHRDPFDRLLIAQAFDNDLTLVSTDRQFAAYQGLKLLLA